MSSFIEQLKRIVTRQKLLDIGGVASFGNTSLVRLGDRNATVEEAHAMLENQRRNLYVRATDQELEEYAEQAAPMIGKNVDSFFETLKRMRELARDRQKWDEQYQKSRNEQAANEVLQDLSALLAQRDT